MKVTEQPAAHRTFRELHSEEVQEMISRPPSWLVSWGISAFTLLLGILGVASWLIRYPDVVPAPFLLTAMEAPRAVVVRIDGKLERLLVHDGETVRQNQPLAYSESTGDPEQVLQLSAQLKEAGNLLHQKNWPALRDIRFSGYNQLGELQPDYEAFSRQLLELNAFLSGGFYLLNRSLLAKDMEDLKLLEQNLTQQLELQQRDFELARQEFAIQQKLFDDKVIAPLDFRKEQARFLAREIPLKNLASSLVQNRSSQTAKEKELLTLEHTIEEKKSQVFEALHSLDSRLETWKRTYILFAPVDGKVAFSAPWQVRQHLHAGQELLTVEPASGKFRGYVSFSQGNLGKVTPGQHVLIKLDGYPYREYGILDGVLTTLSVTPGSDSTFWGYVDLPNQLTTRQGKTLGFKSGLKGTAEIITVDRRLIDRLFSTISRGGQ